MKKRFSNNKGFSLVELIIVVAIMAILIGILAPQYIKYVEKSRISADEDNIDALKSAAETMVADPDTTVDGDFTITVSTSKNTKTSVSGADATDATNELKNIDADYADIYLKSKQYSGKSVTIKCTFTNGLPTVTVIKPASSTPSTS